VMVANGPYCESNNVSYEPLYALLDKVAHIHPNLLILAGPFVDVKNDNIATGKLDKTFQKLFDEVVAKLKHVACKVVLVPSLRDAHHDNVFPQPPFTPFADTMHQFSWKKEYPNIECVPNPCTFLANGIGFGVCSSDTMLHLSKECYSKQLDGPSRYFQLARHCIQQQSYYPLWPGAIGDNSSSSSMLNAGSAKNIMMPYTPDILLFSSSMGSFVENVDGVLCINPSKLVLNNNPGNFAILDIHPTFDLGDNSESIAARTRVELLRI